MNSYIFVKSAFRMYSSDNNTSTTFVVDFIFFDIPKMKKVVCKVINIKTIEGIIFNNWTVHSKMYVNERM